MSLTHKFKIGQVVKFVGKNDEFEVDDVTHQHLQLSLGKDLPGTITIGLKDSQYLEILREPMTDEDRLDILKEALTLIYLNDRSAISGCKRASEFAEETLKKCFKPDEDGCW